jgi:RNA polymerase sigma-70 factor (ECF subfamily)
MLEFQPGSRPAFEALMHKYYPLVLNFIYRFLANIETAEDLTQEVFIRVYKSGSHYKPKSKFRTWLYTIAKNISLNELRKNKNFIISLDEPVTFDSDGLKRQSADQNQSNPDKDMIRKEKATLIRQAINDLPDNQRMAVILGRFDDFSYAEIAATLGVSEKAVKSLLSRAKENLKRKLSRIFDS